MIVKTDAVVLGARRFRESSKIMVLYTREFGRISVVARGVMQPKNRLGWILQPMAHLSVLFYRKEGRDLQNLSSAETLTRQGVLHESLDRMAAGMAIVELVNAAVHDEDRNEQLFEALATAIQLLNEPAAHATSVQLWFVLRIADLLGYAINLSGCGVCDEAIAEREVIPFNIAVGAPLCRVHEEAMAWQPISLAAYRALRHIESMEVALAAAEPVAAAHASELLDVLTSFIRYHVEGMRRLKVGRVSARMLGNDVGARG